MADRLPPGLANLFQPRPSLRFLPAHDHAPAERRTTRIEGVAGFVLALHHKKETDKDLPVTESIWQKNDREQLEKREAQRKLVQEDWKTLYKPHKDPQIIGDAFRTIIVARLPYEITREELEMQFSRHGPIERIRIITVRGADPKATGSKRNGHPRGYAFVLFEKEVDARDAYKKSVDVFFRGRRAMVDVERGRAVAGWKPRRFGGGLEGRHRTREVEQSGYGGRGPPQSFGRGGFRGGHDRGGFRGGSGGGRGGFRGGFGGGRGGIGYHSGGAPTGAPAGPRSGGGYGGGYNGGGGGGGYDRGSYGPGRSDERNSRNNANLEPLPPRGGAGSYRDRDRDRDYHSGQKRPYDGGGGGYDDSRSRRRY